MKKESKIYIAGHTGMVGSAMMRNLLSHGYHNIVGKTLEELDLTNQQAVSDFFAEEKPEYVFLAAAKVGGIMANNTFRGQFIYENLMIQNNIIHHSHINNVTKLLFLGSSCIYPKNCPQPMKESFLLTGELEPTNEPYAIAKIAGIKMCESYYKQYGCNFISVMPTNLYGPNDNYNLANSHVLPAMIRKFHLGKCLGNDDWTALRQDLLKRPIDGVDGNASKNEILGILNTYGIRGTGHGAQGAVYGGRGAETFDTASGIRHLVSLDLWGTGLVSREFMHVDDMAAACIYVMQNTDMSALCQPPAMNSYFINIGTGEELTVAELANLVQKITGFSGTCTWDPSKPDGIRRKLLDCTRLQNTGFKAAYSLEEGVRAVYSEYCKN